LGEILLLAVLNALQFYLYKACTNCRKDNEKMYNSPAWHPINLDGSRAGNSVN